MNWKLKDRNHLPPGGWIYREAKTGWKAPEPLSTSFDSQVSNISSHRAANPQFKLSSDKIACADALDKFTCARLGNDEKYVQPADDEAKTEVKKNSLLQPISHSQKLGDVVERVVRGVKRLINDAKGTAILTEWVGSGMEPVDMANAEQRARTCLQCPKNTVLGNLETAVAKKISEQETVRSKIGSRLPADVEENLNSCEVCGCYLKLKVWVPEKTLEGYTNVEEFPADCWLTEELMNKRMNATKQRTQDRDNILTFYKNQELKFKPKPVFHPAATLTNCAGGFGDTLILTDIYKASGGKSTAWSHSAHFQPIMSINPYYVESHANPLLISAPELIRMYDCGNGHFVQRIRNAYGYKVDDKPQCQIRLNGIEKKERVILHFDAGVHSEWQKKNLHPRARQLYPENKLLIEKFIKQHPELEFIEIGQKPLGIKGATYIGGGSTMDTMKTVATGKYFIGIISGPYHVATALGLKVICIINFPKAENIFLPTLKAIDQVEMEWFYPQNVHLHQDGEGKQVKRFTLDNLNRALNGEVYPYWSDEFLGLIHEAL